MRPIDGVSDSAEAAPDCAAADADAVGLAAAGALVTGADVGAAADEVGVDPHTLGFHESADGLGANDVVAGADGDAASVVATWENPADLSTFSQCSQHQQPGTLLPLKIPGQRWYRL